MTFRTALGLLASLVPLVPAGASAADLDLSSGHITGDLAAVVGMVLDPGNGTQQRYCFVTTKAASASNPRDIDYAEYRCVKHIGTTHVDPATGMYDEITVELSPPQAVDRGGVDMLRSLQRANQTLANEKRQYFDFLQHTQPYLTDANVRRAYDTDPNYRARYDAWLQQQLQDRVDEMRMTLAVRAEADAELQKMSRPVPVEPPRTQPPGGSSGILGQELNPV